MEVDETEAEIEIAPPESEEKITIPDLFPEHPESDASTCQLTLEDQYVVPEDQPNNQLDDQESLPQNQKYVMKVEECVPENKNQLQDWPEDLESLPSNQQSIMEVEEYVPTDKNKPENHESQPRIQQHGIKIKESKIVAVEETQAELETAQTESEEKITFSDAFPQDQYVVPEDQPKVQDSLNQSKQSIMKVKESLSEDEQHISKVLQLISEDRESRTQSRQLILKVKKSLPFPEEKQSVSEDFKSLNEDQQSKSYDSEVQTENLSVVYKTKQDDLGFSFNEIKKRLHEDNSSESYCPVCKKKYSSFSTLKYHMQQHRNPKKFLCKLCDRFLPISMKNAHNKLHTKVADKFTCMICDKSFMTEGSLNNHTLIHKRVMYPCKICFRSFFQKKNLNDHIAKMHIASPLKNLIPCFICGILFKNNISLDLHLAKHF